MFYRNLIYKSYNWPSIEHCWLQITQTRQVESQFRESRGRWLHLYEVKHPKRPIGEESFTLWSCGGRIQKCRMRVFFERNVYSTWFNAREIQANLWIFSGWRRRRSVAISECNDSLVRWFNHFSMEELANNLTSSPTREKLSSWSGVLLLARTKSNSNSNHCALWKALSVSPELPLKSKLREFRDTRRHRVEHFGLALDRTNHSFIKQIQNTDEAIQALTAVLWNLLDIRWKYVEIFSHV